MADYIIVFENGGWMFLPAASYADTPKTVFREMSGRKVFTLDDDTRTRDMIAVYGDTRQSAERAADRLLDEEG